MSIVILNGKVSFSNGVRNIDFRPDYKISNSSIKRINRLVREGKAKIAISWFNSAVIMKPS